MIILIQNRINFRMKTKNIQSDKLQNQNQIKDNQSSIQHNLLINLIYKKKLKAIIKMIFHFIYNYLEEEEV